jgi:hypothetical protein
MSTTIDLEPWLEILDVAVPASQDGVLVRLAPDGDDIELGVLPLDGLHPAELLEGFTAPTDWSALGLVARGWAAPMGDVRPSAHPSRRRVTTTVLVDREGRTVGRTCDDRGNVVIDGPPKEGRLLDLLRTALGIEP